MKPKMIDGQSKEKSAIIMPVPPIRSPILCQIKKEEGKRKMKILQDPCECTDHEGFEEDTIITEAYWLDSMPHSNNESKLDPETGLILDATDQLSTIGATSSSGIAEEAILSEASEVIATIMNSSTSRQSVGPSHKDEYRGIEDVSSIESDTEDNGRLQRVLLFLQCILNQKMISICTKSLTAKVRATLSGNCTKTIELMVLILRKV